MVILLKILNRYRLKFSSQQRVHTRGKLLSRPPFNTSRHLNAFHRYKFFYQFIVESMINDFFIKYTLVYLSLV
jgi:hypothetical protein